MKDNNSSLMKNWDSIAQKINLLEEPAIDFYKHLHANPELSDQEFKTAALLSQRLEELGFKVTNKIGGTGVVGVLKNGTGPTVLFRADMDALPVKEESGLDYASKIVVTDPSGMKTPVMHACGHDVHMTSLLYAAKFFAENTDCWKGTFIVLFQPAEETAEGAEAMVKSNLKELIPQPDVALAQHVMTLPAGKVYVKPGIALSTGMNIRVTVFGRGAHGSMPEKSIDPAIIVSSIVTRLQTIVAREISPQDFAVVTVGKIRVGSKANIISDQGELEINIRAFNDEIKNKIISSIEQIVKGECIASGCEIDPEIDYFTYFPLTVNKDDVFQKVSANLKACLGEDYVETEEIFAASEDFSEIPDSLEVPYLYMFLGGTDPKVYENAVKKDSLDSLPANHSPFFTPVLKPTLLTGIKNVVASALTYLG